MHIAQFVQRYPPALGGSEAYTARLCDYLAAHGDTVDVWTTTAVELEEFWRKSPPRLYPGGVVFHSPGSRFPRTLGNLSASIGFAFPRVRPKRRPWAEEYNPEQCMRTLATLSKRSHAVNGVKTKRFAPLHFPLRRYVLKAMSLVPHRVLQCLTRPCNPVCPAMWRAVQQYDGPLDAVHATAFPYSFPIVCGLKLARRRGVPFFLTPFLHLGDDRTRRQYTAPHLRWLLHQADRVFVQTHLERDAVIECGVREDRVILQGLGVDPAECTGGDREAMRRAWNVSPGECVIGHLANNSVEKGTVDLLKASAGRFRVVLAGPEMPNFRTFWKDYPHKDRVMRLGVLSDQQKRDFFAGIDVFALPSRSDSFGLVLLEAWANGKPNVVYRAGGPGELVRHRIDGLHAACGNVEELSMRLGELASDERLRRRLSDNGLSRIDREFQWADKLEQVRKELHQAAERPVVRGPRFARGPVAGLASRQLRV